MRDTDFIATAWRLAESGHPGRPLETDLRRAVSTAYYALFHCLAASCAATLVGGIGSNRNERAWTRTCRALEHGVVRRRCLRQQDIASFPGAIQDFAKAFVELQGRRHMADYAPEAPFSKSDVTRAINLAESVIADFSAVNLADRRAFAVRILFDHNR